MEDQKEWKCSKHGGTTKQNHYPTGLCWGLMHSKDKAVPGACDWTETKPLPKAPAK